MGFDPVTIGIVSGIASIGFGAYSAYQQAAQAKAAAEYESEVAELQATQAQQLADKEANRRARLLRAKEAQNIARIGASGIELSSESPLAVMTEMASQGMMDILNARYEGASRRNYYQNQARQSVSTASSISPFGAAFGRSVLGAAQLGTQPVVQNALSKAWGGVGSSPTAGLNLADTLQTSTIPESFDIIDTGIQIPSTFDPEFRIKVR